jgi:hypothetical protein
MRIMIPSLRATIDARVSSVQGNSFAAQARRASPPGGTATAARTYEPEEQNVAEVRDRF